MKRTASVNIRASAAALGLVIASTFVVACGSDDKNEEDVAAIRAVIDANRAADAKSDVDAYLATVSDDFVANVFGVFGITAESFPEVAAEGFLGTQSEVTGADARIEVDGDTATATVGDSTAGARHVSWLQVSFVKVDGKWLLDNVNPASADEKPDNAQEIEVELVDFGFNFDKGSVAAGKPTVWKVRNTGKQAHILVVSKIPEDAKLDELLQSEDTPEGVTDISDSFIFEPGESGDITIEDPLEAGRYVFLCFVQDPPDDFENGVPHFAKGMVADFTIK